MFFLTDVAPPLPLLLLPLLLLPALASVLAPAGGGGRAFPLLHILPSSVGVAVGAGADNDWDDFETVAAVAAVAGRLPMTLLLLL